MGYTPFYVVSDVIGMQLFCVVFFLSVVVIVGDHTAGTTVDIDIIYNAMEMRTMKDLLQGAASQPPTAPPQGSTPQPQIAATPPPALIG